MNTHTLLFQNGYSSYIIFFILFINGSNQWNKIFMICCLINVFYVVSSRALGLLLKLVYLSSTSPSFICMFLSSRIEMRMNVVLFVLLVAAMLIGNLALKCALCEKHFIYYIVFMLETFTVIYCLHARNCHFLQYK